MKKTPWILCAAMLFLSGYLYAVPKRAETLPEPKPAELVTNAPETDKYMLIAEGGYLNIYQTGDKTTLIASEKLDLSVFPPGDKDLLKKGMKFFNKEAAFSAFEDYVG